MLEFGSKYLFITLLIFSSFFSFSQETEELERIYTILDKYSNSDSYSVNKINLTNLSISKRQKYIVNLKAELKEINTQILAINNTTKKLDIELTTSKSIYEKLIYFAFLNRYKFNSFTFVFSAEDVGKIFYRLKYLKLIAQYRKKTIDAINFIKSELANQALILNEYSDLKSTVIEKINNQKTVLEADLNLQSNTLTELQQKDTELRNELLYKEELYKEILSFLSGNIKSVASEDLVKNQNFENAKGNFSLPLENGIIIKEFGEYKHPVLEQIKVKNDGIDIIPSDDYNVHAVFDGIVSQVISIPGSNRAVLIKHGEYFTVYTNLVDLDVIVNQKVSENQIIGSISDDNDELAVLNFQIWYLTVKQNPEDWIKK